MAQPAMGTAKSLERPSAALLDRYRLDPQNSAALEEAPSQRGKVTLAIVLLVLGSVLIIVGANIFFIEQKGGIPLLVVGSLAFVPGVYYSWIACQACRGTKGFNLGLIPDV